MVLRADTRRLRRCVPNYQHAQPLIEKMGETADGRDNLSKIFRTCTPLNDAQDAVGLMLWTQTPWSYMAMGKRALLEGCGDSAHLWY